MRTKGEPKERTSGTPAFTSSPAQTTPPNRIAEAARSASVIVAQAFPVALSSVNCE